MRAACRVLCAGRYGRLVAQIERRKTVSAEAERGRKNNLPPEFVGERATDASSCAYHDREIPTRE